MMMKHIYILFILSSLFYSCNKPNQNHNIDEIEINCNNLEGELKLSDYISDARIIPLETTDASIIGNVSKVQLYNDNLYILDQLSNVLFVFNKDGKYLTKIDKIGQGPEEYIRLMDFTVNANGVYLLDFTGRSILHYNFNTTFIKRIRYNDFSTRIMVEKEEYWLYNEPTNEPHNFQLISIDNDGDVLSKYLERGITKEEIVDNWAGSNEFQENNGKLYFSDRYSNIIYKKEDDNWIQFFNLSFGNMNLPPDKNINTFDNIYDESFPFIIRNNFYISDTFVIVDYIFKLNRYYTFHNRQTHNSKSGKVKNDLIANYDNFFPRWQSDDVLIESIDAHYVLTDFKDLLKTHDSFLELEPDDNPILILYNVK